MARGTSSFGKHSKGHTHIRCRRCGGHSYSPTKKKCSSCGFGATTKLRQYAWVQKN